MPVALSFYKVNNNNKKNKNNNSNNDSISQRKDADTGKIYYI